MAVNPYEAPRARVADLVDEAAEFQPVRMWSAKGRIGRLRYLAYTFAAWFAMVVIVGLLAGLIVGVTGGVFSVAVSILVLVGYAALFVFAMLLGIQRSHDMGWSGWTILLALFVPFAGFVWIFKSGTAGANDYGNPPPPNTLGVKILACVLPLIMVAMLAAVAVPAYQQYMERVRAVQQQ
jgi:uncharacterized membrane protein YhaH (DUF805 family)